MPLFKKGSDNLLNGAILGAVIGYLIATSSVSFIQQIVSTVMGMIPAGWNFLGNAEYFSYLIFAVLGGIIGYIVDYK